MDVGVVERELVTEWRHPRPKGHVEQTVGTTMPVSKSPPLPDPAFKTVYSTTEFADAMTIQTLLEGSGIKAEVRDYHTGLITFGFPTSTTPLNVVVASADAAEASKILQETQPVRSNRPTTNRGLWWVAVALILLPMLVGLLYFMLEQS